MPTDFELPPVEHISTKRRIEARCVEGYVYVPLEDPVKEEAQFYEEYIKALQLKFGENSKVLREFNMITIKGFESRVPLLFKDHGGLYLKFANTVLPYLYPLATEEEADRANQFLILRFQAGKLTLKEMTVKMLELLEKRVELVEAYFKFVPQAQNIRNASTFFAYPVIAGVLVVFAVGLSKMKK